MTTEPTISPEIRKAAVDALYKARDSGKMMDQAAEAVAYAVLALVGVPVVSEPDQDSSK